MIHAFSHSLGPPFATTLGYGHAGNSPVVRINLFNDDKGCRCVFVQKPLPRAMPQLGSQCSLPPSRLRLVGLFCLRMDANASHEPQNHKMRSADSSILSFRIERDPAGRDFVGA
jgi:hypothetical protein